MWLYNRNGEPLLDMSEYGRASGSVDWAPDSKKMALDPAFGRPGFLLLYLDGEGKSVKVSQTRHISPPDNQLFTNPKWSTDGAKLAYIAEQAGDQTGTRTELQVLDDGSY